MKSFIAAMVILSLLVGFGFYSYNYLEKTTHTLVVKTITLEKNARAQNWAQTEKSFDALNTSWNQVDARWAMLIDHQELDKINISISRIQEYINTRHMPGLMAELAELKLLLAHIPEKETLNLDNML